MSNIKNFIDKAPFWAMSSKVNGIARKGAFVYYSKNAPFRYCHHRLLYILYKGTIMEVFKC